MAMRIQRRELVPNRTEEYWFRTFGKGFVGWAPNLCLEHTDFLRVRRTMATSIAADLSRRIRLSAEMDKEYGHREFLFRQRPSMGKVIVLPPSLVKENEKYVMFLVTRTKQFDRVLIEDLYFYLERMRDLLVRLQVNDVSLPIIEPGRGNMKLQDLHCMLASMFFGTDITVHLHDRYFLTIMMVSYL